MPFQLLIFHPRTPLVQDTLNFCQQIYVRTAPLSQSPGFWKQINIPCTAPSSLKLHFVAVYVKLPLIFVLFVFKHRTSRIKYVLQELGEKMTSSDSHLFFVLHQKFYAGIGFPTLWFQKKSKALEIFRLIVKAWDYSMVSWKIQ